MAWVERDDLRSLRGKVFADAINPAERWGRFGLSAYHYESTLDGGFYGEPLDLSPQRVVNAQLDGWRVIRNGWHYALGRPTGESDGWVGFGGRQGAHWARFRLQRVGYLHWPARAWDDIGGAPNYARANLSQAYATKAVTPADDWLTLEASATWQALWTTPGGGRLDIIWRVQGEALKEEIMVNQAARGWIAANRPPSTPLAESWFGFVFRMDWSDIPRILRGGVVVGADDDFDDSEALQLGDASDRLLTFLPVDRLRVGLPGRANAPEFASLRKRFWYDGVDHWMLVGVRCDALNGLKAGDLYFDPTFDITASTRDGAADGTNPEGVLPSQMRWGTMYVGRDAPSDPNIDGGWIFAPTIGNGDTINTGTLTITRQSTDYSAGFTGDWTCFAADNIAEFADADAHRISDHGTRTSSPTADDSWTNAATHTTPSLVTHIQAVVDRAGWASGQRMGFTWRQDGGAASGWFNWTDYTDSAANSADLTTTYTAASTDRVRPALQPVLSPRPVRFMAI